ncbi:MAG: hypothetical protein GY842_14715, partial [bacterium]|nr:hypothetical protein [bacterium]
HSLDATEAELSATQREDRVPRRLGRRQLRLADQLRRLTERFGRIGERVRLNDAFDQTVRGQLSEVTGQLEKTASGTMPRAAWALDRSSDPAEVEGAVGSAESGGRDERERLAAAGLAQGAAVDELRRALRWMGRWGDFEEVVARTRDLLDRQQRVCAASVRCGQEGVGREPEELSEDQRARLDQAVRAQRQLAREAEEWLIRNRTLVPRLATRDAAAGTALESAMRVAEAHRVQPRMERAAADLAKNRSAAAVIEQRGAETGLAAVLAALESRQARELAELHKSTERMMDAVAELLRGEEALLAATVEAGGETTEGLADEQRTIRRNGEQLGAQLGESPATAKAAGEMVRSFPPMKLAEEKLRGARTESATADERKAIAALERTLEALELLAAATEHRMTQKTLAETRRKLETIRAEQTEINQTSAELVESTRGLRRPTRATARRASRLAGRQTALREKTEATRLELESAVVYSWVLERVSRKMDDSRGALANRRIDDVLVEIQRAIVGELGRLIDAVAAIEDLPEPDEYASGSSGGGGGGGAAKQQAPVPPVAELIVIKSVQTALNRRTTALHERLSGGEPTESDLRQVRSIGEEQEHLRKLTERLTQQARTGD